MLIRESQDESNGTKTYASFNTKYNGLKLYKKIFYTMGVLVQTLGNFHLIVYYIKIL